MKKILFFPRHINLLSINKPQSNHVLWLNRMNSNEINEILFIFVRGSTICLRCAFGVGNGQVEETSRVGPGQEWAGKTTGL